MQAAAAMASHPWRVVKLTITSRFFSSAMPPHLFLPLMGWKRVVGSAPIVALYGASANPQLRGFEIYYAVVLVPFLVLG